MSSCWSALRPAARVIPREVALACPIAGPSRSPFRPSLAPRAPPRTSSRAYTRASLPPAAAQALERAEGNVKRWVETARTEVGRLGDRINEATGYEEIDKLKALVAEREDELQASRDRAKAAKTAYNLAISTRASSQSSINSLLERKHLWTDSDVSTFTTLIRSDHASTSAVSTSSAALDAAELGVDRAFTALTQAILRRYHEEQVWSDKIRAFSSWAGAAGLVLNLVVFVGAIAFVEPWKRRRLAEGIEARMGGMMRSVEERIDALALAVGKEGAEGVARQGAVPDTHGGEGSFMNADDGSAALASVSEEAFASSKVPPSPLSDLSAPTTDTPTLRAPLIQTRIPSLPPRLQVIAEPSHERDMAAAATAGAVLGAVVVLTVRALRG